MKNIGACLTDIQNNVTIFNEDNIWRFEKCFHLSCSVHFLIIIFVCNWLWCDMRNRWERICYSNFELNVDEFPHDLSQFQRNYWIMHFIWITNRQSFTYKGGERRKNQMYCCIYFIVFISLKFVGFSFPMKWTTASTEIKQSKFNTRLPINKMNSIIGLINKCASAHYIFIFFSFSGFIRFLRDICMALQLFEVLPFKHVTKSKWTICFCCCCWSFVGTGRRWLAIIEQPQYGF